MHSNRARTVDEINCIEVVLLTHVTLNTTCIYRYSSMKLMLWVKMYNSSVTLIYCYTFFFVFLLPF